MVNCEHRDKFCLACGLFAPSGHNREISQKMEEGFNKYFKQTMQKKWYIPEVMCSSCQMYLLKDRKMRYVSLNALTYFISYKITLLYFDFNKYFDSRCVFPVQWLPRSEHKADSCYFCVNFKRTHGFTWEKRNKINYEMVASVLPAVQRSEQHPLAPGVRSADSGEEQSDIGMDFDTQPSAGQPSSTYQPERQKLHKSGEVILFTRKDIDALANELRLTPKQKEILRSRLEEHNAVYNEFIEMFRIDPITNITYCWNIRQLFLRLKLKHNPDEWRLFIDG